MGFWMLVELILNLFTPQKTMLPVPSAQVLQVTCHVIQRWSAFCRGGQHLETLSSITLEKLLTCVYHICMWIHSLVSGIVSLESVTERLHDKSHILAHTYFRKTTGTKMDWLIDKKDSLVDKPVCEFALKGHAVLFDRPDIWRQPVDVVLQACVSICWCTD